MMGVLKVEQSTNADNELTEACLSALETITRHCPKEISNDIIGLFKVSLDLLAYDPNYTYTDDAQEDADMDGDDEDGWGDLSGDEEEAGTGEDTSWKVRRGAVQLISAIIKSKPEIQRNIVEGGDAKFLVGRFKERTEDVKVDLLACFGTILTTSVEVSTESIEKDLQHKMSVQRKKSYTE